MNYHKRPEWSYSSMKAILDSGIDYAVAAKEGILPPPTGTAIDIGQLVHQTILGGDDTFVSSPFPDFRTKAAREWRDAQISMGHIIVTADMLKAVDQIVANIKNHPHTNEYLLGKDFKYEQEMFAKTAEGVALRGKADSIKMFESRSVMVTDIKTTAKFDEFSKKAYWRHYDLQSAVYSIIAAVHMGVDPSLVEYMFCVAETVAPYRVQYFHASGAFLDTGESKLRRCIDAIVEFGDREPNFLLEEIKELGDLSL